MLCTNEYCASALETSVREWADERGLLADGSPKAQAVKMMEEAVETLRAVHDDDLPGVVDGIGDVCVTLIILAAQYGYDLAFCLDTAYQEIRHRKGKTVNGMFVKEKDE